MNFIYHDNQLRGTQLKEWSKKPTDEQLLICSYEKNQKLKDEYQSDLAAALAKSAPVVEEEQEVLIEMIVKQFIFPDGYGMVRFGAHHQFQDDTLYFLDIEMEEVEQFRWVPSPGQEASRWFDDETPWVSNVNSHLYDCRTALRIKKEGPTNVIQDLHEINLARGINDYPPIPKTMNQEPDKKEEQSFEDFVIIHHPDPAHLMGKSTIDAWNEICKLAEHFRGKRKGSHKKIMLVWNGVHENRMGRVVELEDQAVIYIDGEYKQSPPPEQKERLIQMMRDDEEKGLYDS